MECIVCQAEFDSREGPCPKCDWDPDEKLDRMAGYRLNELVNDRYEIHEGLGVGRLGTVLSALDTELGIEVALKVIHPSLLPVRKLQDQFIASVRSLMGTKHENMASLFDVGRDEDERCYISRQLLGGVPLARLMENRRVRGYAFPMEEVLPIVEKIAQMSKEIEVAAHGFLSPEKIWILPDHLKITDTGMAACLPQEVAWHCLRGEVRSRNYAAPEIGLGYEIDARTDVFSVAALVGEMLTQTAFDGRCEIFRQSDPSLSPKITSVLEKALSSDPDDRYQSLTDFVTALGAGSGRTVSEAPMPIDSDDGDFSFLDDGIDEISLPSTPKYMDSETGGNIIGDTAQVLMEDVIRAHEELQEPSVDSHGTKSDQSGMREAPFDSKKQKRDEADVEAPRVPPNRPTDLAGLGLFGKADRKAPSPPASPQPKLVPPPVPKKQSLIDTQRNKAPAPTLPPASAKKKTLIEPKRPLPVSRDTRPPAYVKPPVVIKADDPPEKLDEAITTSPRGKKAKPGSSLQDKTRDKTQEIDISDLAEVEDRSNRREATQEIDIAMLEAVDGETSGRAVYKLEKQAVEAERDSANELIRRARRLDGVDPRLVRAAHKLESDRRGAHSRQAAQILKERAEHLEDIDPRLLRAAARLEEARVREASTGAEEEAEAETEAEVEVEEEDTKPGKAKAAEEEDWRERLSKSPNEAVISFLAPATAVRASDVTGFPKIHNKNNRSTESKTGQKREPPVPPPPSRRR